MCWLTDAALTPYHAIKRALPHLNAESTAVVFGVGGGLGIDGGMAEYLLVPSARLLVPLGGLSPAKAAPLSDAALTMMHKNMHAEIIPAEKCLD